MAMTEQELSSFMVSWLSEQLRRDVTADASIAALGLDSLDAVRLTDALAEKMGIEELPVSVVLEYPSVAAIATHLATLSPVG